MRPLRTVTAAGTAALLGAAGFLFPASAASPGVGTAISTTKVLSAQLGAGGSLLDLGLITDEARSTIDPAVAPSEAYSRLSALTLKSKVAGLNLSLPTQPIESRSPGGDPDVTYGGASLPTPATVASGSVKPARLSSAVDGGTATSAMTAEIANLNLVGGLIRAESVRSVLATAGKPELAESARTVAVGPVTVLDLGAVLEGLGIGLSDLPVDTLLALIDQLDVPVAGVPAGVKATDHVKALNTAIDDLQGTVDPAIAEVTKTVESTTNTLLGSAKLAAPSVGDPATVVTTTVDQVQALIEGVVGSGVTALDNLALLKLDGLELGVTTKAVHNVDDSVAAITAKIGKVHVGNIVLPGIDLGSSVKQVSALANQITGEISKALAIVDPGLANLVKVSVLEEQKGVSTSDGYVRSRAGVTALSAAITPPAALGSIVSSITTTKSGDVGTLLGTDMPAVSGVMDGLQSALGLVTGVLTQPALVKVGEVQGGADFIAAGSPVAAPGGMLPRTGGPAFLAGLAALLLGAVVFAFTGLARRVAEVTTSR